MIVLGTSAAALVAATQSRVCHDEQGREVACRSSGSSGAWTSSSRRRTNTSRTTVSRGGFGSTGSGLFSGG